MGGGSDLFFLFGWLAFLSKSIGSGPLEAGYSVPQEESGETKMESWSKDIEIKHEPIRQEQLNCIGHVNDHKKFFLFFTLTKCTSFYVVPWCLGLSSIVIYVGYFKSITNIEIMRKYEILRGYLVGLTKH